MYETIQIKNGIKYVIEYKIDDLGQVFTPIDISTRMISLIENGSKCLEPSCGDGVFFKEMRNRNFNIVGVEIDGRFCPEGALNMDFFDFNPCETFDTIIGNPPYVRGKKISRETIFKIDSKLVTHGKSNLYLYFIEIDYITAIYF